MSVRPAWTKRTWSYIDCTYCHDHSHRVVYFSEDLKACVVGSRLGSWTGIFSSMRVRRGAL